MTVLANDDGDDSNETPDLEMTETQPAEEMNVTREADIIDIFVEVIWVHGENVGALPTSVDLYLYDEAGIEAAVVTVDESDGWEHTFTDLEQGDYTVRQGAIDNYGIDYSREDSGEFIVRNTFIPTEPETMDIPVEIMWVHGDNTGPYPASADIYLYDEAGVEVTMVTVDESDGWQHTFTDLEPGDYTVWEAAIEDYVATYARDEAGKITITNTYFTEAPETMDIPVEVIWVHGDNKGPFPTSVDIYLYDEAGVEVERITIDGAEGWQVTFINLEPGEYTVREAAIENYDINYARDESGKITITNTYLPSVQETIDILLDVVWVHGKNKGPFPASVDLYLYDEAGVEVAVVTIDETDGWQHTFTNLEPGDYTVKEAAIEHYEIDYARDEAGNFTVTNKFIPREPETMDISVEVVWVHGENKGPFPTSVDLYLYDEAGVEVAVVTIDETDGWQHTFTNLEPGEYTVREAAIENYDINYARDESGKITITNTYLPLKKPVEQIKPEASTKPGEPAKTETPIAELPQTGIAVSHTILIVGGVLLAVGAALLIFTRRRNTVK